MAGANDAPCDVREHQITTSEEVRSLQSNIEGRSVHVNELIAKIAENELWEAALRQTVNEREHIADVLRTEVASQKILEEERREVERASADMMHATNNTVREELKQEKKSSYKNKLEAGLEADELRRMVEEGREAEGNQWSARLGKLRVESLEFAPNFGTELHTLRKR